MSDPQHFLDLDKLEAGALRDILARGNELKSAWTTGDRPKPFDGKTLVMIFEKPSTRTRVSFQVGMQQLGGMVVVMGEQESQLGRGETPADTARVLSRYADAIMIRTDDPAKLDDLAAYATVPVINGLTDASHPCQIMADIMTYEEHRGSIEGRVVTWSGDGNNVAISLALGMASTGGHLTIASPDGYVLPESVATHANLLNAANGGSLKMVTDPVEAVSDADVVYTDVWTSMGQEEETRIRLEAFKGYQVNPELLDKAPDGVSFMHDLPAHPGEEISDGLLTDPRYIALDQAENRLHAQAGLLHFLFAGA